MFRDCCLLLPITYWYPLVVLVVVCSLTPWQSIITCVECSPAYTTWQIHRANLARINAIQYRREIHFPATNRATKRSPAAYGFVCVQQACGIPAVKTLNKSFMCLSSINQAMKLLSQATYRFHETRKAIFAHHFGFALSWFSWIRFQIGFDICIWLLTTRCSGQRSRMMYLQIEQLKNPE